MKTVIHINDEFLYRRNHYIKIFSEMTSVKTAFTSIILLLVITSVPIAYILSIHTASGQIVPARHSDKIHILNAGIKAYNSAAEFGPITVGPSDTTRSGSSIAIRTFPSDVLHYYDPNSFSPNEKLVTAGSNVVLKDQDLLSNQIQKNGTSYIESTFRTLNTSNAKDNHNGILWYDGYKPYYAFLRPDSLVIFTPDKGEIASVPAVHNIGKWDTLKVVYRDSFIDVFLNNAFKTQIKNPFTTINATNEQNIGNYFASWNPSTATSNQGGQCNSGLYFLRIC